MIDNVSKIEEDFDMMLSKSCKFCRVFNDSVSVVVLEMVGLIKEVRQVFISVNRSLDDWIKYVKN